MRKKTKTIYQYKRKKETRRTVPRKNHKVEGWIAVLYLFICLILLLTGLTFPAARHKNTAMAQKSKAVYKKATITPNDIANTYASYFEKKNYSAIWSLFTPSYQQSIQNSIGKENYLSFLQKKFANVTVYNATLKSCTDGQTIFPYGVERTYKNVCTVPITFSLGSSNASVSSQLSFFSQVPLIITKTENKYEIVGGGPTDLQAPVLFPNTITTMTDTIPVIMYHRIAPMPSRSDFLTDYGYRLDVGLTVTPQNFAEQMTQLQNEQYHTISPNDLFNHLYYNIPLPQNPILLTFDDGRLSDFTYGLPILKQHNFTATFFIPPYLSGKMFGFHNHNKYMSFAQLQILAQDGMYVENHSLKHDKPLWDIPYTELTSQLTTANTELFATTHYPIQFIAYPGRWPYANWNQIGHAQQVTEDVLSQMGFAMSFLDLGQNEALENSLYPYQIPRIRPENMVTLSLTHP